MPADRLTPYLCVADARAAMRWYADVLGAAIVLEPILMEDGSVGHVELAVGGPEGARWMMSEESPAHHVEPHDPTRGHAVSLHLEVDDVDAVASRAEAGGATVDRGPEDSPPAGRVAVFRDPFGQRWFLAQPLTDR